MHVLILRSFTMSVDLFIHTEPKTSLLHLGFYYKNWTDEILISTVALWFSDR